MDLQRIFVQIERTDEMIELLMSAEDVERAERDSRFLRQLVDEEREKRTLQMLEIEENRGREALEGMANDDENNGSVFIWTERCVNLLLALYEEHEGQFAAGAKRHQKIWEEIASRIEKAGYAVKWSQCQSKLNSLKRRYKTILDHNNKSGNDRKTWIYFEKMEEMFGKTGWTNPIAIATEAGPSSPTAPIGETPKRPIKKRRFTSEVLDSFKEERAAARAEKQKRHEERAEKRDIKFEKLMAQKERQHKEKMEMMKLLLELLSIRYQQQ